MMHYTACAMSNKFSVAPKGTNETELWITVLMTMININITLSFQSLAKNLNCGTKACMSF